MDSGAAFGGDGLYRYKLWRTWDDKLPRAAFLLLNPSTADQFKLDPTLRRCLGFSLREGCGGMIIYNIFALRSTDPKALYRSPDPIGPENNYYLEEFLTSELKIAGWGGHGGFLDRSDYVRKLIAGRDVKCLGLTKHGEPKHPLYLRADTPLVSYSCQ